MFDRFSSARVAEGELLEERDEDEEDFLEREGGLSG